MLDMEDTEKSKNKEMATNASKYKEIKVLGSMSSSVGEAKN